MEIECLQSGQLTHADRERVEDVLREVELAQGGQTADTVGEVPVNIGGRLGVNLVSFPFIKDFRYIYCAM